MSTTVTLNGQRVTLGTGCRHWQKQIGCGFTKSPCRNCPARGDITKLRGMVKSGELAKLAGK
jgi:hypothetical protein